MGNKVTVFINNQAYQVDAGNNLLAGVLANHLNLPYFCWHPAMGSVGACRQCAVTIYQDENDQTGRIAMACTTPVSDGLRVTIDDPSSVEFREQIIAAMMTNHPHDCPVCAEGGECHLQDMTVMTGHTLRQYSGKKRTFTNQYLGELVGHEMNRCITCYRCVRFYQDYAGGTDFGCYGSKNQVYFGRQQEGTLESEFSGNLVEVCPTGVFTNKPFSAHYARKWDLKSSPSVCGFCSIGCNTTIGERYGIVRRVINRYNEQLNGYFLCDRGRYGLQFVNNKTRITTIRVDKTYYQRPISTLTFAKVFSHFRNKKWLGIGSGRACVESNILLQEIVGKEHFNSGWTSEQLALAHIHRKAMSQGNIPTLREVENADWVFIVGQDIQQSHPRLALSVRQALRDEETRLADELNVPSWQDGAVRVIGQQRKKPLYSLQFAPTKLDEDSKASLIVSPDRIPLVIAHFESLLKEQSRAPKYVVSHDLSDSENEYLSELLVSFLQAKRPVFISGWSIGNAGNLQSFNKMYSAASAFINTNTPDSKAHQIVLAPNTNDVGLMHLLDDESQAIEQQLDADNYEGVIVLENALDSLSENDLNKLKHNNRQLIVLEHLPTQITELADIVLPVSPVSEYDGHFANYRGDLQRFYAAVSPQNNVNSSWYWLTALAEYCGSCPTKGTPESLKSLHQIAKTSIKGWPFVQEIDTVTNAVAQETHRVSGRTAKQANINVHEPQTQCGANVFHPSMEGDKQLLSHLSPFDWSPGWNANQSANLVRTKAMASCDRLDFSHHGEAVIPSTQTLDATSEQKRLYNMPQWQRMELQSSKTIDLAIRAGSFVLYVSQQEFQQQQWEHGQWMMLNVKTHDEKDLIAVPAQVCADKRLPNGHSCSQIEWLAPDTWYNIDSLFPLSIEEQEVFQTQVTEHITRLKSQQQELLVKLKNDDQFIPIYMTQEGQHDA
ncbi:NADH-quinone oxidoreductase subunit NuoG [Thalassotalea fusca]